MLELAGLSILAGLVLYWLSRSAKNSNSFIYRSSRGSFMRDLNRRMQVITEDDKSSCSSPSSKRGRDAGAVLIAIVVAVAATIGISIGVSLIEKQFP